MASSGTLTYYHDVQGDKEVTLFIKSNKTTQVDVSFTYDTIAAALCEWFTYCNSAGTAVNFTCNNTNKAFPITMKGTQMRVVITNTDATEALITSGLD